jgi:CRISPR-associated protein (TIGR02584 family)
MSDKKVILIATMGASPAVLTETVWSLSHATLSVVPDEIVVLTPKNCADRLKKEILSGEESVWNRLLKELVKDKINIDGKLVFGEMSIHVIPDAHKNAMWDLRSSEDNLLAADFMMQEIRKYSESPDTEIIASIAGGRKTMSALLLSCMTLLGREEDKVVHVLLPEELEGVAEPPIYFPQKGVTHVSKRTGKKYKGDKLCSELFEVPFVRMRGWYNEKFKTNPPTYLSLVKKIQQVAPPAAVYQKLEIDFDGSGYVRVLPERVDVKLSAPAFLLMVLIAKGITKEAIGNELYRLKGVLADADFPMSVKWNDKFCESPKFSTEGMTADNLGDFADCMSEIRTKLIRVGFSRVEDVAPKRSGRILYPLSNFALHNVDIIPADIRGCLISSDGR